MNWRKRSPEQEKHEAEILAKIDTGSCCVGKEYILEKAIEKKLPIYVRTDIRLMDNMLRRDGPKIMLRCASYDIFFMSDEYEGIEEHWHYFEAVSEDQQPWLTTLREEHPNVKLHFLGQLPDDSARGLSTKGQILS